jgi:dTDP-4-dehydrorhamnose 3,5-epimerase
MRLAPTPIAGAFLVELAPSTDERGSFVRVFDRALFARHALAAVVEQASISRTAHRGTLRGLHYQAPPHGEGKLVRVSRGRVHDVIVDLRPASPSFRAHLALELDAGEARALYVPRGCAHGFLTLVDDVEVSYQMDTAFVAAAARGVRWNDPAFGIAWPAEPRMMSSRDASYPDFLWPELG